MTNQEKADAFDALADISVRIAGCFGSADKIFAGHPNDEARAKKIRQEAYDKGLSLEQIMQIVDSFLLNTGFPIEHVREQKAKARAFFAKKLLRG